uniref:Uncharacterized protein n=1 Tax=Caenorhabditis tropicalis TaxID=1561998 RepID=A0A1I7U0R2_9PELO
MIRISEKQVVRLRETTIREVYHPPVEWLEVIKLLLPEAARNNNIVDEFTVNVGRNKEFDVNNLFWKSFEIALIYAMDEKPHELTEYLLDKSPHLFTNSPLNYLTNFMRYFIQFCNWSLIAHNELYMIFDVNRVFFQFTRGGVFLRLVVGQYHLRHFEEQLNPFLNLIRYARIHEVPNPVPANPTVNPTFRNHYVTFELTKLFFFVFVENLAF